MKDVIQKKLEQYSCKTSDDEELALKELTQEVILYALSKTGFFKFAAFQGGTCLRIVHGIDRFSEDLDFCLIKPNKDFDIDSFLNESTALVNAYGYDLSVSGKDKSNSNVRMRFLKDDSLKLHLQLNHHADIKKKIKIKVEIDINPPENATFSPAYVDFPTDFSLTTHDLPTLFAGKCHAILCRDYCKGRDWYDLSWYVAQGTTINYLFLANALNQAGPFQGKKLKINAEWLNKALLARIESMNWKDAIKDVSRFVRADKVDTINLWSTEFFTAKIKKMFGS
jgi:predicted nucleotidyltransferase component of viral defense system